MIHRRALITGLISLVAAPAIVRISSIMPVRTMEEYDMSMEEAMDRMFIRAQESYLEQMAQVFGYHYKVLLSDR